MTTSTTTLELPRNLRFTIGDCPTPVLEHALPDRLTQISRRQHLGLVRDTVAGLAVIAVAMLITCGLAGL